MLRQLLVVCAFACAVPALRAGEAKAPAKFDPQLPPCVVETEPASRSTDVDPALRVIKVTFDRPMETGRNWAWILLKLYGVYPGVRGGPEPRWENGGRTCVLAVRLRPGTVYAVGINSYRDTAFHAPDGRPAVPYALVFKTRR